MKTGMKIVIILFGVVFLVCAAVAPAFAAKAKVKKNFNQATKDTARAAVDLPANIVAGSVNVVGTTVKDTADVVVKTTKVTGETLTGDVKKAPEIVTTPVMGSAETVKDTAVGTVEIPVKAGKKTAEQTQ
ncbi:hypothetical protein ACFL5Y_02590 [Candidatus Omnitrophota bacterium]